MKIQERMSVVKYSLLLNCILSSFCVQAQEDSTRNLPNVVVFRELDSIAKIAVITSPVPHFKLNNDQINSLGVVDVGEALKFLPGVQIRDYGGIGGIKSIAYRGIGAAHTAVQVDGSLIATTQTGVVNLSGFETFGLEAISFSSGQNKSELVSASSYIQSNTISAVSVLSQRPNKAKVGLYSNSTSINAYEKGAYVTVGLKKGFFIGGQGMFRFGNGEYEFTQPELPDVVKNREHTALFSQRWRGVMGWSTKKTTITAGIYSDQNEQELPGAAVLFNPSNDQKLWTNNLRVNGNYQYDSDRWSIQSNLNYQKNNTRYLDPFVLNLDGFIDASYRLQQSTIGTIVGRKLKRKSERIFLGLDYIFSNLVGNQLKVEPHRFQYNSVFGVSKWIGRLNIETNVSGQFIQDRFNENENKERFRISPFFSMAIIPFKTTAFRIRTFYKNTFRMPSFNDLYFNAIGNTNLEPENTDALNLGLTYGVKWKKWNSEVTIDGYYNRVANKIVAIPTKDLFNWSMQNIGKVEIIGLDIALRSTFNIGKVQMNLYSNHNFNTSSDVTDPDGITYQQQIPYTPFYSGSNGLSFGWKQWTINSNVLISGFRYSLNENNYANLLDGFTDLNAGVTGKFKVKESHQILADIKVMNVLDNNYQVIRSFPMPGRYYQLRLIYKMEK